MSYIKEVQDIFEKEIEDIFEKEIEDKLSEEIFDLVIWNLEFGISVKDTLDSINRLDLLECFEDGF